MTESSKNIFKQYEEAAEVLFGGRTKTRAIDLSVQPSRGMISPAKIRSLYESLTCDGWNERKGKNWVWRLEVPEHTKGKDGSAEVSLERTVAELDVKLWGCQMSTSSGVEGPYLHRRRAIDLVRFISQGHYAFVELKVDSNNPLYAAVEILGYALAYLHAGKYSWTDLEVHDVFDAKRIELTILGPENWYTYGRRGTDKKFDYKLEWLADEIASSLNDFVTAELKGKPTFTMKFRKFSGENLDQQAAEIHCHAESWGAQ